MSLETLFSAASRGSHEITYVRDVPAKAEAFWAPPIWRPPAGLT